MVEDGISEEVVAVIAAAVSAHGRLRQHPIPSAASSAAVRTVPFGGGRVGGEYPSFLIRFFPCIKTYRKD